MSDLYGTSLLGQKPKPVMNEGPRGLGRKGNDIVATSVASGGNPIIKTLSIDEDMGPDNLIAMVQNALEFPDSDGMVTEDLIDRVKNFQEKQGLQITGNPDASTLSALGVDYENTDRKLGEGDKGARATNVSKQDERVAPYGGKA